MNLSREQQATYGAFLIVAIVGYLVFPVLAPAVLFALLVAVVLSLLTRSDRELRWRWGWYALCSGLLLSGTIWLLDGEQCLEAIERARHGQAIIFGIDFDVVKRRVGDWLAIAIAIGIALGGLLLVIRTAIDRRRDPGPPKRASERIAIAPPLGPERRQR